VVAHTLQLDGVNGDVRQRWNSHVFAALAVDAAAIQQRAHVQLVQPVRFIYTSFRFFLDVPSGASGVVESAEPRV
jgi:hypothetical protein